VESQPGKPHPPPRAPAPRVMSPGIAQGAMGAGFGLRPLLGLGCDVWASTSGSVANATEVKQLLEALQASAQVGWGGSGDEVGGRADEGAHILLERQARLLQELRDGHSPPSEEAWWTQACGVLQKKTSDLVEDVLRWGANQVITARGSPASIGGTAAQHPLDGDHEEVRMMEHGEGASEAAPRAAAFADAIRRRSHPADRHFSRVRRGGDAGGAVGGGLEGGLLWSGSLPAWLEKATLCGAYPRELLVYCLWREILLSCIV
jgi:hypothetical protein